MSLDLEKNDYAYTDLAKASFDHVREVIRSNQYAGHTAGLCNSFLQCNIVILPKEPADEFEAFCHNNPTPCPLIAKSKAGSFKLEALGKSLDLRTDLPLYNIYDHGKHVEHVRDISSVWHDDFVAFAIGCSFTFERALSAAGIAMRHVDEGVTVPMFRTNRMTIPAGTFGGKTVVSMRPIKRDDLQKIYSICAKYPHAHGEPIHIGDPCEIGISDLNIPDWGAAVSIFEDELPVFWGCGVTTQVAVAHAKPELCITHAPGAMLITEIDELSSSDWRPADPPEENYP